MAAWKYRPSLDGLRTLAVYFVLLFHAGLPWARGGFIGVDLFFVLSGYLVTSVLFNEISDTGRLRIGTFYARRVRRLLPAAVVTIVATSVLFLAIASVVRRLSLVGDAQSALLYVANWHFLSQSGDYFAADINKSPFLHFWSLSIEEQYYVFFPVLLVVLMRFGRRFVLGGLGALFALSLAAQIYWGRVDTMHAYYGTDARLYQLFAGALLAVAFRSWSIRLTSRGSMAASTVGLGGLLVLGSGLLDISASSRGIGAMAASVALIGGLVLGESTPIASAFARPVPVFLGRISYGTYLWHWPVIVALRQFLSVGPLFLTALAAALATGLAALSYEVLEMPIRRSPRLDRLRVIPAVAGVATSAVLAVTLVPWVLHLDRRPQITALTVSPAATEGKAQPVPSGIDWAAVERNVGQTRSCGADDVARCTVVHGSGPHVLFIGDSQAQMLVPMFEKLAREHDFTLSLNVVAGCPWQEDLINLKQSPGGRTACDAARVGWYDHVLPLIHPDIVVLLDRPRDDPAVWADLTQLRNGKHEPLAQMTYETTRDTLAKISAKVPHVLVVQRLVMPETFQPNDCLSSAKDIRDCAVAVPLTVSASDGYFLAAAAESPAIHAINLNPAFCPDAPLCRPIVDGRVVWRDDHHLTADYAVARRTEVWRILSSTGLFPG